MSTAAAEEPAVPGALHLPHPLQHIPTPREEELLAALLHSLDGTGTGFSPPLLLSLFFFICYFISLCVTITQGKNMNVIKTVFRLQFHEMGLPFIAAGIELLLKKYQEKWAICTFDI